MPYDTSWITADMSRPPYTAPETQARVSRVRSQTRPELDSKKLWAVVPARKGSVGVPDKNVRPLGSGSLIDRALACAERLGGEVVLSTDYDPTLIKYPSRTIFMDRPEKLATHDTSMWDVLADLAHKLRWDKDDLIVLLQPTSLHEDRYGVVRTILRDGFLPTVTVEKFPDKWHPWYALAPDCHNHPPTSRHALPERFRPNGLAYAMSGCTARRGSFWQDCPRLYEVHNVVNIDTMDDWHDAVELYG